MDKLYYLIVNKAKIDLMFECLKSFGLKIDAIKNNSLFDGEIIMWCSSEKYPSFVFRSQEDIIKKCGIKVDY